MTQNGWRRQQKRADWYLSLGQPYFSLQGRQHAVVGVIRWCGAFRSRSGLVSADPRWVDDSLSTPSSVCEERPSPLTETLRSGSYRMSRVELDHWTPEQSLLARGRHTVVTIDYRPHQNTLIRRSLDPHEMVSTSPRAKSRSAAYIAHMNSFHDPIRTSSCCWN